MKEVIVSPTVLEVTARVHESPVPRINADEILVKVMVAASNPKASTIPLTILAAAPPLFRRQSLPAPWAQRSSNADPVPLIIYGALSALGTFAIKLATLANIHPIIAICGQTGSHLSTTLDPALGDRIVDYREGVDAMKAGVIKSLNGLPAYDALAPAV
ncbi:uncharacterized protein BO72DRAFT_41459 [Aspergillus fijiensis CBS 313.89]|uniref:Uncharacterized protein n=1 Tax=Aspergillus fijiensis CBS 313.89 TaxID=1448319 RepID=A0A8G1RUV0_9EURO|nr:uncharacterized protein BO72DRAFT_41459 [Aspergillus fijiensis CBS 313.89]RAK79333.1 hypothetical protein BO72DRAFT_41459 [Aspergillus fijiensis CBS 313.89]